MKLLWKVETAEWGIKEKSGYIGIDLCHLVHFSHLFVQSQPRRSVEFPGLATPPTVGLPQA